MRLSTSSPADLLRPDVNAVHVRRCSPVHPRRLRQEAERLGVGFRSKVCGAATVGTVVVVAVWAGDGSGEVRLRGGDVSSRTGSLSRRTAHSVPHSPSLTPLASPSHPPHCPPPLRYPQVLADTRRPAPAAEELVRALREPEVREWLQVRPGCRWAGGLVVWWLGGVRRPAVWPRYGGCVRCG